MTGFYRSKGDISYYSVIVNNVKFFMKLMDMDPKWNGALVRTRSQLTLH